MTAAEEEFATPRIASGGLFTAAGRVLLVHKTYGNGWDIPGGYANRGESPASACEREIWEELGLRRVPGRLLVNDWAPRDDEGDKMLFIFDCGTVDLDKIRLDGRELDDVEWVEVTDFDRYLIPRLQRRLAQAVDASASGSTVYLEHGQSRR